MTREGTPEDWADRQSSRRGFYQPYDEVPPQEGEELPEFQGRKSIIKDAVAKKLCVRLEYQRIKDNAVMIYLLEPRGFTLQESALGSVRWLWGRFAQKHLWDQAPGWHKFRWDRVVKVEATSIPFSARLVEVTWNAGGSEI